MPTGNRKRIRRYTDSTSNLGPSTPDEQAPVFPLRNNNDDNSKNDDNENGWNKELDESDAESYETDLSSNRDRFSPPYVSSPHSRLRRRLGLDVDRPLPECPSEKELMQLKDYDPEKSTWSYYNGTNVFSTYCAAYHFVQTTKLEALHIERNLNIPSNFLFITNPLEESFAWPKGGILLSSPYRYGVNFNNMELKWESYLHGTEAQHRTLGHFTNSRLAAAFFDIFVRKAQGLGYFKQLVPVNGIAKSEIDWHDKQEILEAFRILKNQR